MVSKYEQQLVGVPPPEFAEAPASWITRVAAQQVIEPRELCEFLGVPRRSDIDLAFASRDVYRIASICGFKGGVFRLQRTILSRLRQIDRSGAKYLLWEGGLPRYRFCPLCLGQRGVQCFPIHWRFNAWRWGPKHDCLMEDRCPHCKASVTLPRDMLAAGQDGIGVGTLGRCLHCGERLWAANWSPPISVNPALLSTWELTQLGNGRALLAALHVGHAFMVGIGTKLSLRGIRRLETWGLLPHGTFGVDRAELERREGQGFSPRAGLSALQDHGIARDGAREWR